MHEIRIGEKQYAYDYTSAQKFKLQFLLSDDKVESKVAAGELAADLVKPVLTDADERVDVAMAIISDMSSRINILKNAPGPSVPGKP